jgi:uroporphyrinogen decarboxylase
MRQAGRYLPEYRELRAKAGSFLQLCDSPELACEVTLQPLRRFDLDAAIVFADILLMARGLGCDVDFRDNEGPVLSPICSNAEFKRVRESLDIGSVDAVFATVSLVKKRLYQHPRLSGFCGGPWTVASYMIGGGGVDGRVLAKQIALQRPVWFMELLDRLIGGSVEYLCGQVEAGADVVQVFDSWAGELPELLFDELVFIPLKRIVDGVKARVGSVPVIAFARGIGAGHLQLAMKCGVSGVSVEQSVPLDWLRDQLGRRVSVQGNLDPLVLVAGGDVLERAVRRITSSLPAHSHIFNLGHGVRQETPPSHVGELVAAVRQADGVSVG